MKFLTRISNGWELAKISFATINKNRSLLLFPVFSVLSLILVLATFCGGAFFLAGDEISAMLDDEQQGNALLGYSIVFLYYLINFFIIVFFNSALIHCAVKTLNDEETSLSDGISFAFSRIDKILGWSVLSATVGTLLQVLHNTGKIGEIVASLIGIAWSILTFFVVPVLAYENTGPFEAIKRSSKIMKENWGESLAATFSFALFQFLAIIIVGIPLYLIGAAFDPITGIILAVTCGFIIFSIFSAAENIFISAVYHNIKGDPVKHINQEMVKNLFESKK